MMTDVSNTAVKAPATYIILNGDSCVVEGYCVSLDEARDVIQRKLFNKPKDKYHIYSYESTGEIASVKFSNHLKVLS